MTASDPDDATPSAAAWLEEFAALVGTEPLDEATMTVLLDLAGEAAHRSERIAAPLACYLIGRVGLDPAAALDLAQQVSVSSR